MRLGSAMCCGAALWLAGCGGGSDGPPTGLAFAGTLQVTSALPAGTTTCLTTTVVTFSAAGADIHNVSMAGGGCLQFVNTDTTVRRPATTAATNCPALNGPSLAKDETFTTVPFDGPQTCQWQDSLHPVPVGGGSGY